MTENNPFQFSQRKEWGKSLIVYVNEKEIKDRGKPNKGIGHYHEYTCEEA